jgi:hypothetical protein
MNTVASAKPLLRVQTGHEMLPSTSESNLLLSKEERRSIDELTLSLTPIPRLKRRYWIVAFIVVSHALATSILAIFKPELYVSMLVSPSIDNTSFLVRNTTLRGLFGLSLILGWIVFRNNEKWAIRIIDLAIFFVCSTTILFYTNLISMGHFEATTSTLVFTVWRPLLVALLFMLRKRMRDYLGNLKKFREQTKLTTTPW